MPVEQAQSIPLAAFKSLRRVMSCDRQWSNFARAKFASIYDPIDTVAAAAEQAVAHCRSVGVEKRLMNKDQPTNRRAGIEWMREASPYIRAHRQQTFVVYIGGEALQDRCIDGLVQDLVLLRGLGVRLVLVHGARPQIDAELKQAQIEQSFLGDLRVTDLASLACVKRAVADVRIELEASLSQAVLDNPYRESATTIASGNFVIARPAGIINGVDLHFTGEVRRIDSAAIARRLDDGDIVLISSLGYSPTGEVFNLNAMDLAASVACDINAAKLILMVEPPGIVDETAVTIRALTIAEVREFASRDSLQRRYVDCAARACQFGVGRVHIVDRAQDGVLIEELFTRAGAGTMISNSPVDQLRRATIEDVGGILALIEPLEQDGLLVKRSREKLEMEIDHFSVLVREQVIVACGALHPFPNAMGEIACIAVHADYRSDGFGNVVLRALERRAEESGMREVFALTTQASHWFQDSGYVRGDIEDLPIERLALYNVQRNSVVLQKSL